VSEILTLDDRVKVEKRKLEGNSPDRDKVFGGSDTDYVLQKLQAGNVSRIPIPDPVFLFTQGEFGILETTHTVQLYGGTGKGKTLFAMSLAFCAAAGADFLGWECPRPRRVLFFDGELPLGTLVKRMVIAHAGLTPEQIKTAELNLVIVNRDLMFTYFNQELFPLDTPQGEAQLNFLMEAVKPELCIFDSRYFLLSTSMMETDSLPQRLVLNMRKYACCAVWTHHMGKDEGRGAFGDKTAEWGLDTNIALEGPPGEIQMRFKKKRHAEPDNTLYADLNIEFTDDGWQILGSASKTGGGKSKGRRVEMMQHVMHSLHVLTNQAHELGEPPSKGHTSKKVMKIHTEKLKEHIWRNNSYDQNEKKGDGYFTDNDRKLFQRATNKLQESGKLIIEQPNFWFA
jgi:hypothetical protein